MNDPSILEQPLDRAPLAVLDLETTGLSARGGDRVVEVAVVLTEGFAEKDHFARLVHPERALDPRAAAINGITEEMVAGEPPFRDLLPDLERVLQGRVLVAHNARFDLGFLEAEYERAGTHFEARPTIDTVKVARAGFSFRSNSLGNLARHYGLSTLGAHRALADVRMTLGVLEGLARDLAPRGVRTLRDLLTLSGQGASSARQQREKARAANAPPELEAALRCGGRVALSYRARGGYVSERVVRPLRYQSPYFTAYCESACEERTFRVDRVFSFRVIDS